MTFVNYRHILIIKPGAMGDLLQLTPTLRALRQAVPGAEIDVMVGTMASGDIFRYHPSVSQVLVCDKSKSGQLPELWRQIRRRSYDLVVNYQRSNWRTWLLASAAFPCRLLTYHKSRDQVRHAVEDHLAAVAPLGIGTSDLRLELRYAPEHEAYAEQLWRENGLAGETVVALNPGASHPVNRWSTAHFAGLTDALAADGIRCVLIGGPGDRPLAEDIVRRAASRPLVLTGTTRLLQLGAVLSRCALLVSGDTGPMHLATAVGTRVAALFGAADPARTGPVGTGHRVIQAGDVACVPCRSRTCTAALQMECMERITVEQVSSVVREMLAGEAPCGS